VEALRGTDGFAGRIGVSYFEPLRQARWLASAVFGQSDSTRLEEDVLSQFSSSAC